MKLFFQTEFELLTQYLQALGAFFVLFVVAAPIPAYSQSRYERATVPLKAQLLRPSPLQKSPDAASPQVSLLRAGEEVIIRGRQGEWFQVDTTNSQGTFVGWVPGSSLKVIGPIKGATPTPMPAPQPRVETQTPAPVPDVEPSRESHKAESRPIPMRIVPKIGFSYGAKDFPNQYRGGVDILAGLWPGAEFGGTLEIAAKDQFTVALGPTISFLLPWPSLGGVHFSPYAGGRAYVVSSSAGGTDALGGFSAGVNISLMRMGSALILTNIGADILMFGSPTVSVPVSFLLGAAFAF